MVRKLDLVPAGWLRVVNAAKHDAEPGWIKLSTIPPLPSRQSVTHLVDKDFKPPFSMLIFVVKLKFKEVLSWNRLVFEGIRVVIVVIVLANVSEAKISQVIFQTDAEDAIVANS